MATVGNLNGKISIAVDGISDIQRLESSYHKLKSAQDSLTTGSTRVNATAVGAAARDIALTEQITGRPRATPYDPARLTAFSNATQKATLETKKLWAAQVQAKVAANALAVSLGGTGANSALAATRNLGNTAADSQKKYARFGVVVQQAGYQMQDFAVQVAGGQNALVALSQQGSQMLGVFGVGGAIAGAVLSVGILGARMLGLGSAVKSTVPSIKDAEDAWASYGKTVKDIRFGNMTPEAKKTDLQKQISDETKRQQTLIDLQTRFGKIGAEHGSSYGAVIGGLITDEYKDYTKFVFPTLNQQLKYLNAIEKAKKDGAAAPSPFDDKFGGGAVGLYSTQAGKAIASLLNQIETETGAGAGKLAELQDQLSDIVREANKARFESVADTIAEEEAAKQSAQSRFMAARKENALLEMGDQEKLDYYLKEMEFLDSIGARKTEEFELAKKRARELGTILLGQSGQGNLEEAKRREDMEKTVLGLQSRIPQSLQVNAGASALGGVAGNNSIATESRDIQRQILEGIRALVLMERMAN